MKRHLLIVAVAACLSMAHGETVKMATESFVTNYVYNAMTNMATEAFVTNYVERAAPKKRIAMFIIPLNNPSYDAGTETSYFFNGFELKASTNNFVSSLQDPSSIQFYSDSGIADGSTSGFTGDRMKLFACDYSKQEFRSYNYITNTSECSLFDREFESLIAIVDVTCLVRHPSGDWLSEDNENLSWCFTRTKYIDEEMGSQIESYDYATGTGQYWHPIAPVRWFSKMPNWAVIP